MKLIKKEIIEVKKSKFIGYLFELDSIDEIDSILCDIKKEHKKAKHFPFSYIVKGNAKKSDDGEPQGTAGMQIYNVLTRNKLDNHLIVIVRYFGGTLLGSGNLLRTFSKVANLLVK